MLLLEYEDFLRQINVAIEEKREEQVFTRWINGYQNEMSLDEFKQKVNFKKLSEIYIENKDVETVLDDLLKKFG
ncbi:hypothetical protein CS063_00075 [Sporanaerobium hydrogeniformans]|uniref:Uncharacterized protein n=1 Tax=Sporanaerobium hydrogeniformans TaxID=3072179 RepID=A0AC61DFW7_9FIRM|nr:hypothetical protein [Sporanaerobium hydrogeniformans]PHV71913.1 hypothetical protein CS063_00075 [Sporanaerobium hydrogeniformans]